MLTPFILAPHIEFSKPLHDVEVVEKETAKFECEVSRENVKVCQYEKVNEGFIYLHFCMTMSDMLSMSILAYVRSVGIRMEVKSEKGRSTKLSARDVGTSLSFTSQRSTMRLNTNVMPKHPNPLECSLLLVR